MSAETPDATTPDDGTSPTAAAPNAVSRIDRWRSETGSNAAVGPTPVQAVRTAFVMDERVWAAVAGVLGIIQSNDEMSRTVTKMQLTRDPQLDAQQRAWLHSQLQQPLMSNPDYARLPSLKAVIDLAYDELIGISVLGPLWRDDNVTEIMVDAWNKVTIERDGQLMVTNVRFRDAEHARKIARDLALKVSDRALTPATPLVTAELPGARVAFAIDKVVKTGLSIAMRKFKPLLDISGLMAHGAFNEEMRNFLGDCVAARANVLVSGGTGTGKTTMINALSSFIPDSERVITIEDAYELKLTNTHWVALQTKEASSSDDTVHISMADLLVTTLRMRPDRVIVGEIREAKGAAVMLQAANTGHDGTMTTIHANSADRALNFRLVGLARTGAQMSSDVAAAEVASAINLVVQVVRRASKRYVSEIAVVDPEALRGGLIEPISIFTGELVETEQGLTPAFTRVGHVPATSELGMKLHDAGVGHRWIK